METGSSLLAKNVLFDLDGTLTDPRDGIVRSILYALEKMGRPREDSPALNWVIGPPIQKSFPILLETEDAGEVAQAVAFFRERFSETGLFENQVYGGVPAMLESLGEYRLFIATSKPRVFAERILRHFDLDGHFEAIYGSELDGTRIDKADLIAYLLQEEGLDKDAVMIGDREHDVIGANANGIPCIGVLYGYGSREELTKAGACALCEAPQEIVATLSR